MEHIIPRMDYLSAGHYDKITVLQKWLDKEQISFRLRKEFYDFE